MSRRALLAAGMVGVGGLVVAGCGSDGASAAAPAGGAGGTADGLPNTAPDPVAAAFAREKVVPVIRDPTVAGALATARAWMSGGAKVIEFTTTTPDVLRAVRDLAREDVLVGVGTIRTAEQVRQVAEAGGRFVLSFASFPELISTARDQGITAIPGTMTPTEVFASLAAPMIKVFPASVLGAGYQAYLSLLFPGIRTSVTGGLSADPADARAWLDAGATAVGPAGDLFGSPAEIRKYMRAVRGERG